MTNDESSTGNITSTDGTGSVPTVEPARDRLVDNPRPADLPTHLIGTMAWVRTPYGKHHGKRLVEVVAVSTCGRYLRVRDHQTEREWFVKVGEMEMAGTETKSETA